MKTKIVIAAIIAAILFATIRLVSLAPKGFWTKSGDMLFWAIVGIGVLALIVFGLKKLGTSPSSWLKKCLKIGIFVIIAGMILLSGPRDMMLDLIRRPEVSTAITGTETTRSVQVTRLGPFKVCGLEANAAYTFVKSSTSEGDTYRTMSPRDHSTETHNIAGMFVSTPEELPYKDAHTAYVILLNGLPPGRIVETDALGCLDGMFNTRIGGTRILIGDPWIGFVLRRSVF